MALLCLIAIHCYVIAAICVYLFILFGEWGDS
jgi:hypothetical protein